MWKDKKKRLLCLIGSRVESTDGNINLFISYISKLFANNQLKEEKEVNKSEIYGEKKQFTWASTIHYSTHA